MEHAEQHKEETDWAASIPAKPVHVVHPIPWLTLPDPADPSIYLYISTFLFPAHDRIGTCPFSFLVTIPRRQARRQSLSFLSRRRLQSVPLPSFPAFRRLT